MHSYKSSVSCKSKIILVCKMKENEAEYESRVIRKSERNKYNVIEKQE